MSIAKIIRITADMVCGTAPGWVRAGWKGCELPALDKKIDGFDVDQTLALRALECHSLDAAEWFYSRGYPTKGKNFGFKLSEVEVLRTYTNNELAKLGPLHVDDDMETGTMRPAL